MRLLKLLILPLIIASITAGKSEGHQQPIYLIQRKWSYHFVHKLLYFCVLQEDKTHKLRLHSIVIHAGAFINNFISNTNMCTTCRNSDGMFVKIHIIVTCQCQLVNYNFTCHSFAENYITLKLDSCIFIVAPCISQSLLISIITNAHTKNFTLKRLKSLQHVSILRSSSGSYTVPC